MANEKWLISSAAHYSHAVNTTTVLHIVLRSLVLRIIVLQRTSAPTDGPQDQSGAVSTMAQMYGPRDRWPEESRGRFRHACVPIPRPCTRATLHNNEKIGDNGSDGNEPRRAARAVSRWWWLDRMHFDIVMNGFKSETSIGFIYLFICFWLF